MAGTTDPPDTAERRPAGAPFLVRGTVFGRAREVAVGSPAEALRVVLDWCAADAEACGSWALGPDQQAPVTAVARSVASQERRTRRVAHLFRFEPGVSQADRITARCGETLRLLDAEWLALGDGMPCEQCVARQHGEVS